MVLPRNLSTICSARVSKLTLRVRNSVDLIALDISEIINNEMYLNDIGKIANDKWSEIPQHFQNILLGEFVVMPNHVHGIIIIKDPGNVETGHALSHPI